MKVMSTVQYHASKLFISNVLIFLKVRIVDSDNTTPSPPQAKVGVAQFNSILVPFKVNFILGNAVKKKNKKCTLLKDIKE